MTDKTGPLAPTVDIRRAGDRFKTRLSWLDSKHSFSFSRHYDPLNTHHGLLLVNNDDVVRPGTGFAGATGAGAAPAAFCFASFDFQHRRALGCRPASARPIRSCAAGLAFRGVAANPFLVRALVILRIKIGRRQLLAHRAPPEKANTSTMWSREKIIRL